MKYSVRDTAAVIAQPRQRQVFFFSKPVTQLTCNRGIKSKPISKFRLTKKCQGCGGNCFNTAHWQTVIEIKKMSNYFASSKQAIHNIHARFDENLI